MSDIGIIVIGRNEGRRLRRCLGVVLGHGLPVVYVDSASTDGSAALAREMGAEVVDLDMSVPFSAARARNAGFERLTAIEPGVRYVQFVDGDCEVVDGWLDAARRALESRADLAVVCGRRRERHPGLSIYNRLADHEWDTPVGDARSCGGDAMMRADAFRQVGGFDPSIAAGEEPELCQRLREAGWKVARVNEEMTIHDAAMLDLGQWWKRAVRSGYGAMDVATRFRRGPGNDGLFVRQVKSARLWAVGWPVATVAAAVTFTLATGLVSGLLAALVFAAALPVQITRLTLKSRNRLGDWRTAFAHAVLTMVAKWAAVVGQVRYLRDSAQGQTTRLIDYKALIPKLDGDADVEADRRRYGPRPFLKEQSWWAVRVYRFGRRVDRQRPGPVRWLCERWYWLAFRVIETVTGISIPKSVEVGPGLHIWHFGNIFVHANAKIGANCTLRQGVTIGSRVDGGRVPVLEDDVDLGAYAQVLGDVRVGRGAKIGAMSVVLCDVPAGATAVGVPARIILAKGSNEDPSLFDEVDLHIAPALRMPRSDAA
jgi:serine acetyltransferase